MAKILRFDGTFAAKEPEQLGARRITAEVYEAAEGARDILSAAQAEAQRVRSEAEAERERVRAAAIEAGRQEGLAQMTRLVALAAEERDRFLEASERELLRLSVYVAEKILRREVARDTPVVLIAAGALEEARQRRVVLLRFHPDDANTLRAAERRLAAILRRAPAIGFREDPAVSRGGVVIETEAGTIDAQLETQLEALRSALEEVGPG